MKKTQKLVLAAVLTALILLLAFTPIGYLRVGAFSITFLMIPVAIGAMLLGKWYGLYLGLVFGITSFAQCFGMDAFGTVLCGVNLFGTFVMTVVSRGLMGFLTGVLFELISKKDSKKIVSFIITSLASALFNSIFFISAYLLFFRNVDLTSFTEELGAGAINYADFSVMDIIGMFFTLNSIIECAVCVVISTPLSKVVLTYLPKFNAKKAK